jgi:6-phosphofructokinase 1
MDQTAGNDPRRPAGRYTGAVRRSLTEVQPVSHQKRLAILVGGGPAPGINSVIGAATIRGVLEGVEVLGIRDGFEWIMQGNVDRVRPLAIDEVSRIHFRGGSHIGISRANPTKNPEHLENTVISLLRLNVSQLITIGGDDTAFSAMKLEEKAQGRIQVVHVPKTIDNDLDLPAYVDTFGFQTARHIGVELVKNLMVDAKTTSRWYFVIAMGRKAGHLALGIGKAAGATLTMIPEEFGEGRIRLKSLVDTLVGSILKRLSYGRRDGVAILAEGLVLDIPPEDLAQLEDVERDAHGNVRIAEVNIGEILKAQVQARLKQFNIKTTIVAKNIGYELRCADPIPYDMEYTRDLGYCATKYLLSGGNAAMVSLQGGHFVPVAFKEMLDPKTGKAKIRLVDIRSTRYAIARRYMIRLRRDDFQDPHELAKFAATCGISLQEFRNEFEYLIQDEPPPLDLDKDAAAARAEDGAHQA